MSALAAEPQDTTTSRTIVSAVTVAENAEGTTLASAPSTVAVPEAAPAQAIPEAAPALAPPETAPTSAERPREAEVVVVPARNTPTSADPVWQTPQAERTVAAEPTNNEEVRVLRDVSANADQAPAIAPQQTIASETPVRRLPAPEPTAIAAPSVVQPSETAAVGLRTFPAATVPTQPVAAVQDTPVAERSTTSVRAVVPEPASVAVETAPQPSLDPIAAQPSAVSPDPTALQQATQPTERSPAASGHAAVLVQSLPMKAIGHAWEEPAYLLSQLDQLKTHDEAKEWAAETIREIRKLGPAIAVGAPQTAAILARLEALAQRAPALADKIADKDVAQEICRTAYALKPRIAIWKQIGQMGGMLAADAPAPSADSRSFDKTLADVDRLTADSSEGHAWRKYLLIDSLREWASRRHSNEERMPRDLAQQVYTRLNRLAMTPNQRQFLTSNPIAALNREMIRNTAEPVEANRLLQHLENFERSGLPSDARLLARDCQYLSVSSGAAQRELGEKIELNYRNGNIRLAVTAELLNRMMPKRAQEFGDVEDTIQGAAVRGRSLTANEISVRMIPDPSRVLMALVVDGEVAAVTRSTSGPATFYTDSESSYLARKPLEITLRGIRMWPTEVTVDNNSTVRGVRTDFDGMPLFGRLAREVSISKYDEHRPAADAEVRDKIAAKAKERVDRETTEQVSQAAKRLHDEVLGPMDALLLDPLMVSAETTDKRFNMRIRLAGPDQLGGHTPRPQAPADSLASVQIHESLLNNVLERLELDGQTFDLAGLNRRLAERIHRYQPRPVDPDQEDVKITFAANDAVHVRCNDGRMEIALAIAKLSKGSKKFSNFQVKAAYKPAVEGRSVDLARDGIVQLIGPRMNAGAQLVLRSVFLKIFSDKHPIHITPETFVSNPRLKGVVVTQFVIDDGWIGAALGPQSQVASQAAATR